jgi:hypothetical protein
LFEEDFDFHRQRYRSATLPALQDRLLSKTPSRVPGRRLPPGLTLCASACDNWRGNLCF